MDESAVIDADRHAARASLYAYLAGAFAFPEAETLAELRATDAVESVGDAAAELGVGDAAAAFRSALDAADVTGLETAYNDLFGVPAEGGTYAVPPYEAHYTVGDDVGQQQRRVATVVGLLDAVGLERTEAFAERHDHVVVELELMQVLAAQHAVAVAEVDAPNPSGAADASNAADRETVERLVTVQAAVLDEHLVGFVPAFAHEVRTTTDHPVYAAAARLASRLVRDDHAAFESERPTLPTGDARGVVS